MNFPGLGRGVLESGKATPGWQVLPFSRVATPEPGLLFACAPTTVCAGQCVQTLQRPWEETAVKEAGSHCDSGWLGFCVWEMISLGLVQMLQHQWPITPCDSWEELAF